MHMYCIVCVLNAMFNLKGANALFWLPLLSVRCLPIVLKLVSEYPKQMYSLILQQQVYVSLSLSLQDFGQSSLTYFHAVHYYLIFITETSGTPKIPSKCPPFMWWVCVCQSRCRNTFCVLGSYATSIMLLHEDTVCVRQSRTTVTR